MLFKRLDALLSAVCAILLSGNVAIAEIAWLPDQSTWNATNYFTVINNPSFPGGMGMIAPSGPYGVGINTSSVFTLSFIKDVSSLTPGSKPTVAQSDLTGTAIEAGVALNLVFSKAETDNINMIALVGDGSKTVNFKLIDNTKFSVQVAVVSAVESASGAGGVQFGMMADYQANQQMDFGSAVFVTDIHYQDILPPDSIPTGVAGLKANGTNGVAAQFYAFLPLPLVQTMGINTTTGEGANGYIDGAELDPAKASFSNEGIMTSLGFDFKDSANADNAVLKLKLTNSGWSAHNIQFGKLAPDTTGPTITVNGKKNVTVKSATYSIKGTVTDPSGVKSMQFSTTSRTKGFKKVKVKNGAWTIRLSSLRKGKTVKIFIKATDNLGNVSGITTVQVKRK